MKNNFRILFITIIAGISLAVSACGAEEFLEKEETVSANETIDHSQIEKATEEVAETEIYINGTVEETIEIGVEYVDSGVNCPETYSVITQGSVNTAQFGTYRLKYLVYSDAGEEVKVLYRYVRVVDTTPPVYIEGQNIPTLHAGFTYSVNDFLEEYTDNYQNGGVSVEPSKVLFTTPGSHEIQFTLSDSSGNQTVYTKTVDVELDMLVLLNEVYKETPGKISTSDTSMGYTHTSVRIDGETSLGYFGSGSIHFIQEIETSLGKYGTIQISSDYGDFSEASVSFHVSNLGSTDYSTGSATIDVFANNVTVKEFDWTINKLSLNERDMLAELNEHINTVIANFHDYMNNTLHIEVK